MFEKLKTKLILWLAGDDISVILNSKVYNIVLKANREIKGSKCIFNNNNVVSFEDVIQFEVSQRVNLAKQGIRKYGNGFALDPSLLSD